MAVNEDIGRQLMLRALDESLSPEEQALLETALAGSEALRREQQQLEKLRGLLAVLQPEPSAAFAGRAMEAWRERRKEARIFTWLMRAAAACLLIFALALFSLYWPEGRLDADAILGLESLSPDDAVTLLID